MTAGTERYGDRVPRILVTNDDGVDAVGLHRLVAATLPHGEVTVVAPASEYSGAGAAVGPLHLTLPDVADVSSAPHFAGTAGAYAVTGPPALCVVYAALGAFGPPPDLVVSGINPGANVGRAVYHSGTVGAVLTARTRGIPGVAFSQAVVGFGVEGQGWDDVLRNQRWDSAEKVAALVVGELVAAPPDGVFALNVNVPNLDWGDLAGWRTTEVGSIPPRAMAAARLVPQEGHVGHWSVDVHWGEVVPLPPHLDGGAVEAGFVSVSWLGGLGAVDMPPNAVHDMFDRMLGPAG